MKKILFILLTVAFSMVAGQLLASAYQQSNPEVEVSALPLQASICLLSLVGFIYRFENKFGGVFMAVSVEIWVKYIMDNLFKDNSFLNMCHKDDEYVVNGSVVHIPQAGARPNVTKNRSVYPAVVVTRTDSDIVYPLDTFDTEPTHIPKAELLELSYDKIDSVLREHMSSLNEEVANAMLYHWRAEAAKYIVRTTGDAVASHADNATGNRKLFVKENLKTGQKIMNKDNISKVGRIALLDSELLSQLQDDPDLKKRDVGMELDMKNGVIARLYGFDIMERSTTLIYDNTGTPIAKDYDAIGATTDNASALLFQRDAVARALGTVDFFENLKDATYYGDIYSMLVKMGGRKRRADGAGVVAIVQAAA